MHNEALCFVYPVAIAKLNYILKTESVADFYYFFAYFLVNGII